MPVLARWNHFSPMARAASILPDGCRDVIVLEAPGARPLAFVSPLDDRLRRVIVPAGVRLSGFRLAPGAQVDARLLPELCRRPDEAPALLAAHTRLDPDLHGAITALACPSLGVAGAARQVGVSLRALQRRFAGAGLPSPGFWAGLARVRHAAAFIAAGAPLSEAALDSGFADQAHMTRAFGQYFGVSPRTLQRSADLRRLAVQSGLATGEQISTR